MKESIFISSLLIILLFNGFIIVANPSASSVLNLNYQSLIVTGLSMLITGGITSIVLGDSIIRLMFSVMMIMGIMFQVNVLGYNVGFGLMSSMLNVIINDGSFMMWLGYLTVTILSITTFISGILIVVESG